MKIGSIRDVAEYQLCSGCGACAYIKPDQVRMVDTLEFGRRPYVECAQSASWTEQVLAVCPGIHLEHTFASADSEIVTELASRWGPVREVWEGHAGDEAIRRGGSSGGAATALALHCIEKLGFDGVLHIAARKDVPYLNETVLSRTREELLARTGSRYAPASPCDGLQMIEDAPGPCVFIGKPCDVAAVQKARKLRPALDAKVGLTIAFFCAGVPSTKGTLDLLKSMGVDDPTSIRSLRYRGNGWPGRFTVQFLDANGSEQARSLTYEESWGFLTKYKQWRCNICPDHTGEFADVAVGDPWYRPITPGEPGTSLILARTPHGTQVLSSAIASGFIHASQVSSELLPRSQPNLEKTRGAVWGRLWACRMLGVATPRYMRVPLFETWWRALSVREKLHSVSGTIKRVVRRGLMRPAAVQPLSLPVAGTKSDPTL